MLLLAPPAGRARRSRRNVTNARPPSAAGSVRSVFTASTISSSSTIKECRARMEEFLTEREKRHFPDLHNQKGGQPKLHPTGRVYIPHGHSNDEKWKPHPHYQNPRYTVNGMDWKSNIKWMPDPKPDTGLPHNYPIKWYNKRCFPDKLRPTGKEWSFYDDGYRVGKKCYFDGNHRASTTSQQEITHSMLFGKGRFEFSIDKRNGLPKASGGDKSYQAVEYSTDFHKEGTTRPLPNFGGSNFNRADTFVPLQELPPIQTDTYSVKEKNRQLHDEIDCVRGLETWEPAPPLKSVSQQNANAS